MENTWRVWIVYAIVLSLYCLTAEERARVAKRHLTIIVTELIKSTYFKNA